MDGLDPIGDIADAVLRRHFRGDALHLVCAEALLPAPLRVLCGVLRRLVTRALSDRNPVPQFPSQQLPHGNAQGLSPQIENRLLQGGLQGGAMVDQIHLEDIEAQPLPDQGFDCVHGNEALNLRQSSQALVGEHLGYRVLLLLVTGLAVLVVRPPPVTLRNVYDVDLDMGDLHATAPSSGGSVRHLAHSLKSRRGSADVSPITANSPSMADIPI